MSRERPYVLIERVREAQVGAPFLGGSGAKGVHRQSRSHQSRPLREWQPASRSPDLREKQGRDPTECRWSNI